MEDKKSYRTGAEILLIIAFMVSLGVNVVDNDEGYLPYTCDLENVDDRMCYKLSRVGTTGVNRNCYYDRDRSAKYKVCSTGWKRILNVDDYAKTCAPIVLSYTDNGKYFCDAPGPDQNCVHEKDLSQELLGMLGW